jgi:hypothetical protein
MKKLIVSLSCLSALGFAGIAMAAPPVKAAICHCGCVLDANDVVGMAYVDINVSSRAVGHRQHDQGTVDSCVNSDGTGTEDFMRTGSDCQLSGPPVAGVDQCGDTPPEAGSSCGTLVQP